MEFRRESSGQNCELFFKGRLDAASSESLEREIDEILHSGGRHIRLNMSSVSYMSSAGIRILIKNHREFKKFGGSFSIKEPSAAVSTVLKLSHLESLLCVPENQVLPVSSPAQKSSDRWQKLEHGIPGLDCEIRRFSSTSHSKIVCHGEPEKLADMSFKDDDMHSVSFCEDEFSVGIGAFGENYEDCSARFGEFIAVCGSAACLPSDDMKYPDFVSKRESHMPEMKVLYSLGFKGMASACIRFETPSEKRHIGISEIISVALKSSKSGTLGIAIIAESAGLVGVSLKTPPLANSGRDFFGHPGIRSHLDFSPERVFDRTMILACGLVSMQNDAPTKKFMRPVGNFDNGTLYGHIHSAVFSFHALQKSETVLQDAVLNLFEERKLLGLLHLINDDRDISGIGESQLSEGRIWIWELENSGTEVKS